MPSQISTEEIDRVFADIKKLTGYLPPSAARYLNKEIIGYVSPAALHSYMLYVIREYASTLSELELIPSDISEEIAVKATREHVPFERADWWEGEIKHDIRGLVRSIQEQLSDRAKSFSYLGLTSYNPLNTAQSLALRDFAYDLMIPETVKLGRNMTKRALEYKDTVMIGRTHLQHAEATTAGHWFIECLANIVPPLERYRQSTRELRGNVSGFVGNNAARVMLFGVDPDNIDELFFKRIGLKADDPTCQTVHQHWYADNLSQLVQICGGIAKFANDVRKYQQTEVGEMAEQRLSEQVGSSTGSHKKNPINSERVAGGMWRQIFGDYISSMFDLQTDFQRDLRDSSNKRDYIYSIPNTAFGMARTASGIAEKMTVRKEKMAQNLGITKGLICAEPLQVYMQYWCGMKRQKFFDTHEHVRKLTDKAIEEDVSFLNVIEDDELVQAALEDAITEQRNMILNPEKYIGTSVRDVERYAEKCDNLFESWRL